MNKIARVSILALFVAACGGGGDDSNNPDAPPHPDAMQQPDAAPACTSVTSGAQVLDQVGDAAEVWAAPINEDLGDGGQALLSFQFYDTGTDLVGTFDLTQAPNDNYMACTHCLLVYSLDADGNVARTFFQTGGSITLTTNPVATEPGVRAMVGTADNVTLSEVTIDPSTFESTLVPGGQCLTLGPSLALNQDDVPDTWTCDPTAWDNQDG